MQPQGMTIAWPQGRVRMQHRLLVLLALAMTLAWLLIGVARAASEADFLPPEQAFRFSATQVDPQTVDVHFDVAPGYYLYRERFAFAAQPASVKIGQPQIPAGHVKFDENLGKQVETYRDAVTIRLPVSAVPADGEWSLAVTSQGCSDQGLCYPPMESVYKVGGGVLGKLFGSRGAAAAPEATVAPAATPPAEIAPAGRAVRTPGLADDPDRIAGALASRNPGVVAALFFGLGLLLTFTPCVLPMVPILSSIVVGEHVTRTRSLIVSLAYVLGMAVVYTAVGVAAGLLGEGLSAALQNPWVLGAFAAMMVGLSLSMFGLYELQLPQRWQHHLTTSSNRQQGGQVAGAVVMGALSALIVGPCVTAPLAGALAYIARTGDALTGGGALFAMAIGMGVPLVLVGVGAGNLLPRAGRWMEATKRFFGFLLLGVAIWMVTPVLPAWATMVAWASLLLVSSVFLGAFDALGPEPRGLARLGKGLGVLAALAGAILLVGVASGGRDPLQPLSHFSAARASGAAEAVRFERVRSSAELDARVKQAAASGRAVMLDFYADWCVSCKEMERLTFTDARVQARMGQLVLLQADVTANNADDRALLKRFGLFGPPGIIFFGADGQERRARVIGYQAPARFLDSLERAFTSPPAAATDAAAG